MIIVVEQQQQQAATGDRLIDLSTTQLVQPNLLSLPLRGNIISQLKFSRISYMICEFVSGGTTCPFRFGNTVFTQNTTVIIYFPKNDL